MVDGDLRAIAAALGPKCDALSGSSILVTGAGGFLPSYVVLAVAWMNRNVLAKPCKILALQRTAPDAGSRIAAVANDPNVTVLVQSVTEPLPRGVSAQFIVHAASPASPKAYLARPFDAIDANVWGTRMLLDRAREWQSRSVLFFSSSEPYGSPPPEHIPTPETYAGQVDPLGVRAPYTETKRMGETLCATYARAFGVPARVVRPFHTYGPAVQLDDGRIMGEFLRQRLNGQAIEAKSDGRGIRSFCYVGDATAGFMAALLSDCVGEAFNIGDDREPVTIRQLAHIIAEIESPHVPVHLATAPQTGHLTGTPDEVKPDLQKAARMLGYHPQTSLREGIQRTLRWFREQAPH